MKFKYKPLVLWERAASGYGWICVPKKKGLDKKKDGNNPKDR